MKILIIRRNRECNIDFVYLVIIEAIFYLSLGGDIEFSCFFQIEREDERKNMYVRQQTLSFVQYYTSDEG
jgi:hypothetical protein